MFTQEEKNLLQQLLNSINNWSGDSEAVKKTIALVDGLKVKIKEMPTYVPAKAEVNPAAEGAQPGGKPRKRKPAG